MKKTIYAIAALALLFTGCAKEYNETFAPGDVVTLRAKVNDTYTKVAADNAGTFSWQANDKITVLNSAGTAFEFTTTSGDALSPFTCTAFEGSLGTIAYYPASASHSSSSFNLEPEFAWKNGETNMPMIGAVDPGDKSVSFKAAGAVIKLVCYNVPDDARKLVVSSATKKLSGAFTPSGTPAAIVTADKGASDNTITITFEAGHASTMVFYVPVPTGELGKLSFVMKDGSDAAVSTVQSTKGAITMTRAHIVAAPALNCDGGTVLWSEDFSGYSADDVPTGDVAKGLGGANVTYACTNGGGTTKIYAQKLAGGTSPELLVGKTNGTFDVTNIPTDGCASMILKYMTNATALTLSSPTDGISFSPSSSDTAEEHTVVVTNSKSAASFGITFKATSSSNVRLDDIVLIAPGASFTAPSITPVKESLTIAAAGGSDNTTFTYSNSLDAVPVAASVEAGADWLSASLSGNTLTVTAGANDGGSRSAKVTLRATGVSKDITVTQESANIEVNLSIKDYAAAHSWANSTKYTSITVDDNITATVSGGGNSGKYYTSGNEWRLYQTESASLTITAKTGVTIKKVAITYNVSNTGVLKNGDDNVSSGTKIDVNASSITLNVGNTGSATNGQVKVTSIYVMYL